MNRAAEAREIALGTRAHLGTLQSWAFRRVRALVEQLESGGLTTVLPDGSVHRFGDPSADPQARIRVRDPRFFWRVVRDGDVGLGESYTAGQWDCDDLVSLIRLFHENQHLMYSPVAFPNWIRRWSDRLLHLSRRNSLAGSGSNIEAHYDLGDRLFELFLDATMSYSCALWNSPEESLERAQLRKIDALLDKARLQPGDELLEIGCGWGSLAIRAAQRTGCRVKGITLSKNQLQHARQRATDAGVADRVEFELCDYRRVEGRFDKIISVEMLEAVGHKYLGTFFAACDRVLARDGLVVIQVITFPDQKYDGYRNGCDWLQKYIFPGGIAPSLTALTEAMTAQSELVVETLENIGPHYAPTLAEWRRRFDAQTNELSRRGYDEKFQRTWRYYLAYCEAGFAARTFGDLQLVLTRPNNRSLTLF
ncbi:MAG: class I SAM-dependent methyltransferase [Acidobacteriota bacterium]|nr:MAG: class I SAM-dependent methyltransferase [Acidobacteriota bacterium]